jgi:2-polyprenyl-6-methoxyphenol hydroxylase-like FAD-dependent oxidoreductase
MQRQVSAPVHERAIVIGGSMVGLAVARALNERFREVVLIDRDVFPREVPDHRRGVPQSYHIHNLTLRGQHELEELFPGFHTEALRLGAMQIDHSRDVASFVEGVWEHRFDSGYVALSATRILLEFAERQRFNALMTNATVIEGTRVVDLLTERQPDGEKAVGVVTDNPDHREIRGQLVVDCSGRTARWKSWLAQRGLALPEETIVDSRCGYSSRFYRPRDPSQFPWKAMVIGAAYPNYPHWGVIVPLEQNDWVVTLGGFSEQYPPADEEGFLEFARGLPTPLYTQALERADPLTPVRTFRRLEMRWNHFERYDHPLSRFLAIGDAAWAYNPLYGQGMSIGITCARILRDALRESPQLDDLPKRFYPPARKFAWPAWESTALMDMRWPKTTGKRPWHAKLSIPASQLALDAGRYDRKVALALLDGMHLLKQPHELLTPRVLGGIALYGLRYFADKLPPIPSDEPILRHDHARAVPAASSVESL